jgi:hypothetical protein
MFAQLISFFKRGPAMHVDKNLAKAKTKSAVINPEQQREILREQIIEEAKLIAANRKSSIYQLVEYAEQLIKVEKTSEKKEGEISTDDF